MRFIFLDIENTIIDDLINCNFLEDNCKKITNFINEQPIASLSFFTWGWKTPKEININIVNSMLLKLGKDPLNIGCGCKVLTKEFGVETAIKAGWLAREDFDRAIEPGMMAEFGISKISCFTEFIQTSVTEELLKASNAAVNNPLEMWLVDDLVDKKEEIVLHGGRLKIILVNPLELE